MKKFILMLCVLMLLGSAALAESDDFRYAALTDFRLGEVMVIDGYGAFTGVSCDVADSYRSVRGMNSYPHESGAEADFLILKMDVLNTMTVEKDFLVNAKVKAVFSGAYEYEGWAAQCDYDIRDDRVVDPTQQFPIKPMYKGHYWFGCELPNAVLESTAPLALIITIDNYELIYNVR